MDKDEEEFGNESEEDYDESQGDEEAGELDDAQPTEDAPDEMQLNDATDTHVIDHHEARVHMITGTKITSNFLTRYERTRVLGIRIKQLQLGAPPLVDIKKLTTEKDIALAELKQRKLPFIIRRYICRRPAKYEDWRLCDLQVTV